MQLPVRIVIGEKKAVTITVPGILREQMVGVMADFFARGDMVSNRDLARVFNLGGELTLILTTKRDT